MEKVREIERKRLRNPFTLWHQTSGPHGPNVTFSGNSCNSGNIPFFHNDWKRGKAREPWSLAPLPLPAGCAFGGALARQPGWILGFVVFDRLSNGTCSTSQLVHYCDISDPFLSSFCPWRSLRSHLSLGIPAGQLGQNRPRCSPKWHRLGLLARVANQRHSAKDKKNLTKRKKNLIVWVSEVIAHLRSFSDHETVMSYSTKNLQVRKPHSDIQSLVHLNKSILGDIIYNSI